MLLGNEDLYVRKLAIASLGALAEASPKVAIDLAKYVELETVRCWQVNYVSFSVEVGDLQLEN